MFFNTLLLAAVLMLSSCVGTVQDAASPAGLKINASPTRFDFQGLISANPIAHDKIELSFNALESATEEIKYYLTINDSENPIELYMPSVTNGTFGRKIYVVENLQLATQYKFKLSAKKVSSNSISNNENILYARTFTNPVANFAGVSKLSLVPGSEHNKIKVEWVPAEAEGSIFIENYDPTNYEVKISTNPLNLQNSSSVPQYVPALSGTLNLNDHPKSLTIGSLNPDTTYYVQVRAIHKLWRDAYVAGAQPIPIKHEMNTKFLTIRTKVQTNNLDFVDDVRLANANGLDSFSKINVFWPSAVGSFEKYRVFVIERPNANTTLDLLDPATLALIDDQPVGSLVNGGLGTKQGYFDVDVEDTSLSIGSLTLQKNYQIKVATCRTTLCPLDGGSQAIVSNVKEIEVKPTLAPFSGIYNLVNPETAANLDQITLQFDAPVVTAGYADTLRFYCVDNNNHHLLSTVPLIGAGGCTGLTLNSAAPPIATHVEQKVAGVIADGTREYCFAASPVITHMGLNWELPINDRIVRCFNPDVIRPNIVEFPGIKGNCSVSQTSATVNWDIPTGGIYTHFDLFIKEKSISDKFSFSKAVANDYGVPVKKTELETTHTFSTNLMPGKTYEVGVLASVQVNGVWKYSEFNLGVKECAMPLPRVDFEGFSRIFAIGPKIDGRVPNSDAADSTPEDGKIFEAVNTEGIPYETGPTILNFQATPGMAGANFTDSFDGAFGTDLPVRAMSKNGIVSIGWKDVELEFAQTLFDTKNAEAPTPRSSRKWGYRIYRSVDNKLTWKDMTADSGLVYSQSVNYYTGPNRAPVAENMAFFTDYSVSSVNEFHDATQATDIERARIYWYRIVPVFNGSELKYQSGQHHMVKVTLPPANMALVHRWMANRAACLELNLQPEIANNYTCEFSGLGAKPRSIPWNSQQTMIDQSGDLLMDRNELGCRYTRGSVAAPEDSLYSAPRPDSPARSDLVGEVGSNIWRRFTGIADNGNRFKGCGSNNLPLSTNASLTFKHNLNGDCTDPDLPSQMSLASRPCTSGAFAGNSYHTFEYSAPGLRQSNAPLSNCSVTPYDDSNRVFASQVLQGPYSTNVLMHSEPLAVFHLRNFNAWGFEPGIEGPNASEGLARRTVTTMFDRTASCSINLAAIDGSGHLRPRWASLNALNGGIRFKTTNPNLLHRTVAQITELSSDGPDSTPGTVDDVLTLYNKNVANSEFRLPASLMSSSRYQNTTKIGRMMVSNSSKLPPISRISPGLMDSLCSLTQVELGFQNDTSGAQFVASSTRQAKRPMRRSEFIAASAWSDTLDAAAITTRESGNIQNGGCVQRNSGNSSSTIFSSGDLQTNNQAYFGAAPPLLSGSSADPDDAGAATNFNNSRLCMSRYGIQDLIGNTLESNSESIFCDYSGVQLYIGEVDPLNPNLATRGIPFGHRVRVPGLNGQTYLLELGSTKFTITMNGTPKSHGDIDIVTGQPITFGVFTDGVDIEDQGFCSTIKSNPSTPSAEVITGSLWNDIFLPNNSVNTSVVSVSPRDIRSLYTLRNGDGRFAEFSETSPLFSLIYQNSFSFKNDFRNFNTLLGLPLNCNNNNCGSAVDNTKVLSRGIASDTNFDTHPEEIADFYFGNSLITSVGTADVDPTSTGEGVYVAENDNFNVSVFTGAVVNSAGIASSFQTELVDNLDPGTGASLGPRWVVGRNSTLGMVSGGSSLYTSGQTGRYSLSIIDASYIDTNSFLGGRCAVMVNMD
jgi:hypothetical protein